MTFAWVSQPQAQALIQRRKEINSVIMGASRPEQLDENLLAAEAEDVLREEVLDSIEGIMENLPE